MIRKSRLVLIAEKFSKIEGKPLCTKATNPKFNVVVGLGDLFLYKSILHEIYAIH